MKKVVASIKYRLVTDAFSELFIHVEKSSVVEALKKEAPFHIQPIPLHKNRHKQRGFNQSLIIGKWLSGKVTNCSTIDVLKRVKETKTQATLTKPERKENAKGAFEVKKNTSLKGITVVVVDDVVTTGSTVKEAARVLKEAGAGKIVVFSIAKG